MHSSKIIACNSKEMEKVILQQKKNWKRTKKNELKFKTDLIEKGSQSFETTVQRRDVDVIPLLVQLF